MTSSKVSTDAPEATIPEWRHELSVGNAALDEQHIELLEMGRSMLHFFRERPSRNDQIRQMLLDIVRLSERHDAMEEAVLRKNQCPSLAEHRAAHETARAALKNLLSSADQGIFDQDLAAEALSNWMSHHTGDFDLRVKEYLKRRTP